MRETDCFGCRKQRGEEPVPGGWIYENDLVCASHAFRPERISEPYLGHLLVETRRHAPQCADLTSDEAQTVGRARLKLGTRTSRGGGRGAANRAAL
ncbi:MAG: hypothetical protein WBB74_09330 [Gaiellaceae bacterium]